MAYILSLETATTNCSVSLSYRGEIVSIREDNPGKLVHSERLHNLIEEVLHESQIDKKQIQAIGVSEGPGSFTGLRVGVSAAKGLCFALDIPLIAVPTLEVLARQVQTETGFIIPLLDARRMEVYAAVYKPDFTVHQKTFVEEINENSFSEYKEQEVFFIGDGSEKLKSKYSSSKAGFLENRFPSAREMGPAAYSRYKISDFEDVAYFEPYYLKEFTGK